MGRDGETETPTAGSAARLLVLAALAGPLVYVPTLAFGTTLPGAVWARVAVAGAAACAAGLLATGRAGLARVPGPVAWWLAASLAVAAVAGMLGVSARHSLFGNLERTGGLVAGVHLVAWYLLARAVLDDRGWRWALWTVTAVAAVAGAAGTVEWLRLATDGAEELRAAAPMGNPGQLGMLTALGACSAAATAAGSRPGSAARRAAVAAGVVCLVGLLASGTRAAMLGLGAGAVAGGSVWAWRSETRRARKLASVVGGAALLGVVLLGVRTMDASDGLPGPGRIVAEVAELDEDATLQTRLAAWEAAGEAVADRPAAGWGPENFRVAYDLHGDPDRPYTLDRSVSYDRAHDVFAEAAVAAGIPGLIAAAGLAAALLLTVLRLARREAGDPGSDGALAAGVVAYGTFLLFWYQDPAVALVFLALVGAAAHRVRGGRWLRPAGGQGKPGPAGGRAVPWGAAAVAVLATAVALHAVLLLPPARALHEAEQTREAGRKFRAFDRALERRVPGTEEAVTRYAAALGGLAPRIRRMARREGAGAVLEPAFASARRALSRQIGADPRNARLRALRGRVLLSEARFRGDRVLAERAAAATARAVELAPAQLFYRYTLSEILRLLDRREESVAVLRRAVEAAPRIGQTRLHLARAHLQAGRPDSAAGQLLEGGAAADAAADTLMMRRLLAELPREDERVPEIQELLIRTRDVVQGGGDW